GFPAPSLEDFQFKPIFSIGGFHFTKPMLLALICAFIVVGFFWSAFARPKIVPRGVQNLGELGLMFVRDQILRPAVGEEGDRVVVRHFPPGVPSFVNMLAGTLLSAVFIAATCYLCSLSVFAIFAAGSFLMVVALTAFELLIQFLQAFIFTTLAAPYIARSIEP